MKTVLVYTFKDCEPVEALGTVDVLNRCGAKVTILGQAQITEMAHGVKVVPDKVGKVDQLYDVLVLPGGMGWKNLQNDPYAKELTQKHIEAGKIVAAICAAPSVALGVWGFLDGKKATCYPGMEKIGLGKAIFSEDRVVVDGKFITARGPGVALEFGLEIAKQLKLDFEGVKKGMLVK